MQYFDPQKWHEELMEKISPRMQYREDMNFSRWQVDARDTLKGLLGLPFDRVEPDLHIEYEVEKDEYIEKRFVFRTEEHMYLPCHLLIPKTGKRPHSLVICLQGHSTGMHISLARPKFKGDEKSIEGGDRDFAIQIVGEGYAALTIEQRCFGERSGGTDSSPNCYESTMSAFLLGRTTIGERVWDVSRTIDVIEEYFPEINPKQIGCMGNSGGGTTTYYAACMDERISIAMPSCAVCTYRDSIGSIRHCSCNYIPGIYEYFEMGDLAGLIAPRALVIVAGKDDTIFPIGGVKESFAAAQELYKAAGAEDRCALVVGEEGHRFYAKESWPVFRKLSGWEE